MARTAPVFSDSTGLRGTAVNLALVTILIALVFAVITVALSVLFAPTMTIAERPTASPTSTGPIQALRAIGEPAIQPSNNRMVPERARETIRLAMFRDEDTGALNSLKGNAAHLDGLIPEWLELRSATGEMVTSTARRGKAYDWLKREARGVKLYPLLLSTLSPRETAMAMAMPPLRAALVAQVLKTVQEQGFDGITVGLSSIVRDPRAMAAFLEDLRRALEPDGRGLLYMAESNETPAELARIVHQVDYVLLPLYHRDASSAIAGPIASQGWFEQQLRAYTAHAPPGKLIPVLGSMAIDWGPRARKTELSVQQAWEIASRANAPIVFDTPTLNLVFDYRGADGDFHRVWMNDAVSFFNQARTALAASVGGLALWRLGWEDQGVYEIVGKGKLPDDQALESLRSIEPGFGAFENAKGVLLSGRQASSGTRAISYQPALGLIVAQTIEEKPRQAALALWPATDATAVALTFDDGPDPVWTSRILDILEEHDAKATFYLIGQRVVKHPAISRRILDDGHDIGNHSFSHPDLNLAGTDRISAELTATQRVFEDVLGIRSALFRPPFAMTGYGYLETAPNLSVTASSMGYLFGGIDVDAFDYMIWTPRQIADRVIRAVRAGEGNAVLLHEAGGDRSATVEALPLILEELRRDGYRFVATHELVGVPRDVMMTPYMPETFTVSAQSAIRSAFVGGFLSVVDILPTIAIAAVIIGTARLFLIIVAALVQTRRQSRAAVPAFSGSIAVLVPAFNEEKVVCNTVRGLLTATIADRIVVTVIDDGSTDRTSDIVGETFPADPRVRVLRKENGGKASALNYGFAQTRANVVVAIDGDTVLEPDAIEHLVAPFGDPAIGAVAGRVIVGNAVNLLTRFQSLEYIIGQNLERTAFALFNAIGVVPGAIGAWRRTAVEEVQGYATDTLAEDADLTVAIERAGWKVVNAPRAIALTEAPKTLRAFLKQRFRWMFGTLQVAFKHIGAITARPSGVSLIILPNIALQFAFTLIAPLMDILTVWIILAMALSLTGAMSPIDSQTLQLLAAYWALFQAVDLFTAGVGLALNGDLRAWRLLPLVVLQRVSYRQLLYVVAIRALLAALKGTFVGWGKLARTGRILRPAT